MKKRILSIVLSIVMLVSLLPTTALANETPDEAPEASWVFGAAGITPDYTDAATGTLAEAFAAANGNEESTTIYVQLNENVISEENKYFSLQSNKSMVLDLNEKSISSSDSIYCIFTSSGSSLTVKDGMITVKETKNTGYGFFVNGALTVEDCTINAEQTSSNSVYGINGSEGSSLTVKNSSITARNTENSGSAYGIYADQGTLTVEECNISAESSNRNAYGISTYYTNASISEGTISAQTNSSSYIAYGVYSSYGSVTLSGTPGISATTADFYYPSTGNYKVVFTGTMSAPSEPYSFIGVSGYGFTAGAYLCNINANNFSSYFKAADPTEEVIYDNGELKLVSKPYVWFCTGDGTEVDNIYLPYSTGGTATQPVAPTWEGYTFAGWYTDGTYTTEFDFSQTITQDTGVYAKWTFAATGAEVEDSGTLNGTYGSTLDELIEATLSKLSITVTGENGASLGGFSTSNWTVKEGQELAAAQLGDTVTFVGTLTEPTATNYNSDYNYWYGRLPQWEGELSIEVSLVLNYNVKFSNYNYTTNGDGIMAYILRERSNYYIFDIIGYFDSNWRSTTFGNGGYKTYLKVGDTVEQMSTATSAGGGDTKLGLNVAIDFDFLNQGQTLQIKYTVNNTTEDAIAFSLGSGADVQIGSDDSALITPFADGSGYKMVSDKSEDQSAQGDYAQFNFFGKGYAGVTDVTDFWYGGWSRSDATNGCYWTSNESVAAFYGVAQSESLNDDSAASWHWDDSIGARETKTYSVLIGIGGAGSENAAQGGGLTEPTGSVTIEVSEELTNSNQLVVKLGNITLIEDTDYTVDLSVPDKPVITFKEAAGLNVSSGDLTVTVTFADHDTEDVIITNSIPGTGNISTEEGVLGGVTAEGLDELAKEQNQDIVLTVKEEEKNTEDVEHNAIDTAAGDKTVEFLDITLKDKNSGALITGVLSKVLEIAVPFDDDGKSNVTVYRYHDSAVNTFTMLDSKPADAEIRTDGTFFVDGENNKVYIYTNQFSTYAIGYTMLSTTCTVTFDMNGHGTAIDPATVNSGEKVTKPADPTATGYTFGGWYKEQACTTAWDFDTDTVSGSTTLYAKWTEKATVNITETTQTYTWDGNPQSFIISGIPNTGFAVQYKVNGNWTDTAPSAVGTYDVKITRAEDDTYKAYEKIITGGLVINAATPTANAPTAIIGLIYNGSAQALINAGTFEHGHWEYSLDGTSYSSAISTGTDAKTYTVYCRFVPNTGYAGIDSVELSVTISPKEVAEPTVVGTYTYTGSEQTVTLDGVLDCMTVSGNKATHAGNYELTIALDTNHIWESGFDGRVTWSIGAKAVTPTAALEYASIIYSGSERKPTVTLKDGDTEIPSGEYTVSYSNNVNVGTATVTITDKEYGNYTFAEITKTFEIMRDGVSPVVTMDNYVYGGTPAVPSVSGNNGSGTVTVYYSTDSSRVDKLWEDISGTTLNVGTYYMKAHVASTDNYAEGTSPVITFKVTLGKYEAPSAPTASEFTVTVNEADRGKILEYSLDGANWISVPALTNGAFELKGLSESTQYTVYLRVKASANGNYQASDAVSTVWTTPARYSVAYHANLGTGNVPASVTQNSGRSVTVARGSGLKRTGYTFAGWNTAADGTGTDYAPGSTISTGATLYAKWTANSYTVKFKANGGSGTMDDQSFTYDTAQALTGNAFSRDGYHFAGWALSSGNTAIYMDGQTVKNLSDKGTVTLHAVWAEDVYNIGAYFSSDSDHSINAKLMRGDAQIGSEQSVTMSGTGAPYTGHFDFAGVPKGIYNIVAKQDDKVMTKLVIITDHDDTVEITMPASEVNSVLEVSEDALPVVVGGLEDEAVTKAEESKTVTITMTVEKQEEQQLPDNASESEKATQEAIAEIKEEASGKTFEFMDIEVEKTVEEAGQADVSEKLTETNKVMEIVIPFDLTGKMDIAVYRHHNGQTEQFTENTTKADGTFYIDAVNHLIHVFSRKFSTYAIGYTEPASPAPDHPPVVSVHTCTSKCAVCGGCEDGKCRQSACKDKCLLLGMNFTDVADDKWYTKAVEYVYHHKMMEGVGNNLFDINGTTTRAMIVTILWRLEGEPVVNYLMQFEDIPADTWYTEAVRWAASEKIVEGYSDTAFGPTDPITREQFATILWRYAKYKGYDVSVGEDTNILSYEDAFSISEYAIPAMQWACGAGLMQGDGVNLTPKADATRAQAAALFQRFCENVANK